MTNVPRFDLLGPEADFRPRRAHAAYGSMLAAAYRSLGGTAPRVLVTSFVPHDRPGILRPLLGALLDPTDRLPNVKAFSVEASMCASLAEVSAVALVAQPLLVDPSTGVGDLAAFRRNLRERLVETEAWGGVAPADPALTPIGVDHVEATTTDLAWPSLEIDVLAPGNEFGLFAGREFREVRFGLPRGAAPERCAEVMRSFAGALRACGVPIAYLHYPHRWSDHRPEGVDWLRIAYAVDRGTSAKATAEYAAHDTAVRFGVPLWAYEPRREADDMADRFSLLVDRPVAPGPAAPGPDAPPPGRRVGLCVEGPAKVGLVADVLDALPGVEVHGCTMSVLYGTSVCNLVVDADHGALASERLRALGRATRPVPVTEPVIRRADAGTAQFWVGWYCPEDTGVISRILDDVYGLFEEAGAERPNMHYGITRVLADGFTCAGKARFLADRAVAERLGLVGPGAAAGRAALAETIRGSLAAGLASWSPSRSSWRAAPVVVTDDEPTEEPWASLVVPEGSTRD